MSIMLYFALYGVFMRLQYTCTMITENALVGRFCALVRCSWYGGDCRRVWRSAFLLSVIRRGVRSADGLQLSGVRSVRHRVRLSGVPSCDRVRLAVCCWSVGHGDYIEAWRRAVISRHGLRSSGH